MIEFLSYEKLLNIEDIMNKNIKDAVSSDLLFICDQLYIECDEMSLETSLSFALSNGIKNDDSSFEILSKLLKDIYDEHPEDNALLPGIIASKVSDFAYKLIGI
jgi:hypothetical protein